MCNTDCGVKRSHLLLYLLILTPQDATYRLCGRTSLNHCFQEWLSLNEPSQILVGHPCLASQQSLRAALLHEDYRLIFRKWGQGLLSDERQWKMVIKLAAMRSPLCADKTNRTTRSLDPVAGCRQLINMRCDIVNKKHRWHRELLRNVHKHVIVQPAAALKNEGEDSSPRQLEAEP